MSRKVIILTDEPSRVLEMEEVINFLSGFLNEVVYGGELFHWLDFDDKAISRFYDYLKSIKIPDIDRPLTCPLTGPGYQPGENYGISPDPNKPAGDLYDGYWLQRHLFSLIKSKSPDIFSEYTVILITGRLFGTFEGRRYHARVILLGSPHIISTSGVVEAPARPPEYYWVKAAMIQSGRDISEIDEFMGDKYLVYDDPRIIKIICSYLLAPAVYDISGRAFCDNPQCCIYNSHWQKELLNVQYQQQLCENCSKVLNPVRSN